MECPYCKQEMKTGYIKGDGRWKFRIPGEYCKSCKKLIIDTEISE